MTKKTEDYFYHINSPYYVLGLDSSAGRREILKRSKEITHRLRVGDTLEYELDFSGFDVDRTEKSVKEAVQSLSSQKKRIKEYFFWFQVTDDVDEKAINALKSEEYDKAIKLWSKDTDKSTAKSFLYKKNLAILYSLLLLKENNKNYLEKSLYLWKGLIDSDKFWNSFAKIYMLHDELGTSQEVMDEFRKQATSYVADIYTEIGHAHDDNSFVSTSSKILETKGEVTEKTILNPIYKEVISVVEELESLYVSEDGVIDKEEIKAIKQLIGKLQDKLNDLLDLGLYDDSQSKTIRDRAVKAIRVVSLDIQNNLDETDKALALMNIALEIAGTMSLKNSIKNDIIYLKNTKKGGDMAEPVLKLINEKKYEEALEIVRSNKENHKDNSELKGSFDIQEQMCITGIAIEKHSQALEYFGNKQEELAKAGFMEAGELIYENIELFNFDKKAIDKITSEIKSTVAKASYHNLSQFDEYRKSFIETAKKNFEGKIEETVFIILVDSYIYGGLSDLMQETRRKTQILNALYIIGWLTVWFYGIGLIFFIAGWIYKNSGE